MIHGSHRLRVLMLMEWDCHVLLFCKNHVYNPGVCGNARFSARQPYVLYEFGSERMFGNNIWWL